MEKEYFCTSNLSDRLSSSRSYTEQTKAFSISNKFKKLLSWTYVILILKPKCGFSCISMAKRHEVKILYVRQISYDSNDRGTFIA